MKRTVACSKVLPWRCRGIAMALPGQSHGNVQNVHRCWLSGPTSTTQTALLCESMANLLEIESDREVVLQ